MIVSSLLNDPKRGARKAPSGIHEGIVEYTADPENMGRVKVRIVGVHTPDHAVTPTEALPWALPCFAGMGSFMPPEVGDAVLVYFRKEESYAPVYLGKIYGVLEEQKLRGRLPSFQNPPPKNTEDNVASVGVFDQPPSNNDLTYYQPIGNTAPEESYVKRTTQEPEAPVLFKSKRGHTIYAIDEAEHEAFKMIDRIGQALSFECAVVLESDGTLANKANMQRRGLRDVTENGDHVPLELAVGGSCRVKLMDANLQTLTMTATNFGQAVIDLTGLGGFIQIKEDPGTIQIHASLGGNILVDEGVTATSTKGDAMVVKDGEGSLHGAEFAQMDAGTGGSVVCESGFVFLN